MTTGAVMKYLDIFDLDGTLWKNPVDTPETRKQYEKATGIPWAISKSLSKELSAKHGRFIGPRQGWYGRVETMQPPLCPDPLTPEWFITETVEALRKSTADSSRATVIMTGRHAGMAQAVYRVIHDGKLAQVEKVGNGTFRWTDPKVQLFLLGNDGPAIKLAQGPKPQETFPWKKWIINQFVALWTDLEEIHIWEDRDEHVVSFGELQPELDPLLVKVNHVKL